MSKRRLTIFSLTLICSLLIEFTAQAQSKEAKEGAATVSGRITVKGEPAQGVTITLQTQRMMGPPNPEAIPSAKTDENGHFRITGVAAGRYFTMVQAPGFIIPGGMVGLMPQGRTLHVADGEKIEKIEIELRRGSVITGRVIGSNGRPLVDELVELMKLDSNGKPQQLYLGPMQMMLTTDDRGIYRIYGLGEGRYIVSVGYSQGGIRMGGGAHYQKTYHPDVTDQSQAKVVEVGEGDEVTGVDINVGEAKKTYRVSGRVVNADNGQPVAGAAIGLGSLSPDGGRIGGGGYSGAHSNSVGEFQLSNVAPGKYAAFTTVVLGLDRGVNYYSEPVICEVGDSDKDGIEIKVRKGGSINGLVVIEGTNDPAVLGKMSQLMLHFYGMPGAPGQLSTPYANYVKVNPNGGFQAQGLPPGKVLIDLAIPDSLPGLSQVRIERDGAPQPRDGIEIGAGEQVSNLRLVAAYGTLSVQGEIKIVGGTLPRGFGLFINAHMGDVPTRYARVGAVDTRGHFVIEHLPPGEYELRLGIRSMQPGSQNLDPQLSRKISQVRQKVVVSSNDQQPVILTVNLSQGGSKQ